MFDSPRTRLLAVCCCLLALGGLLVLHGTVSPDPERNHFPGNAEFASGQAAYVGEQVVLDGDVVETDPVVVERSSGPDGDRRVTLVGLTDVNGGEDVWLYGTVEGDGRVAVESAIVRERWELTYMYVVSALGGLWVLGRFLRQWRFDVRSLTFQPRPGVRRPTESEQTPTASESTPSGTVHGGDR